MQAMKVSQCFFYILTPFHVINKEEFKNSYFSYNLIKRAPNYINQFLSSYLGVGNAPEGFSSGGYISCITNINLENRYSINKRFRLKVKDTIINKTASFLPESWILVNSDFDCGVFALGINICTSKEEIEGTEFDALIKIFKGFHSRSKESQTSFVINRAKGEEVIPISQVELDFCGIIDTTFGDFISPKEQVERAGHLYVGINIDDIIIPEEKQGTSPIVHLFPCRADEQLCRIVSSVIAPSDMIDPNNIGKEYKCTNWGDDASCDYFAYSSDCFIGIDNTNHGKASISNTLINSMLVSAVLLEKMELFNQLYRNTTINQNYISKLQELKLLTSAVASPKKENSVAYECCKDILNIQKDLDALHSYLEFTIAQSDEKRHELEEKNSHKLNIGITILTISQVLFALIQYLGIKDVLGEPISVIWTYGSAVAIVLMLTAFIIIIMRKR